jgi:hypothetical protein
MPHQRPRRSFRETATTAACPDGAIGTDVYGERRHQGAGGRRVVMKYMILMYSSQQDYDVLTGKSADGPALGPEDFAPMHAFMESFTNDLVESGELVDTQGLAAPVQTRRIQLKEGVPVVTDGPYAETQEVLSGYWVVECESFDRATEIAARLAGCPSPGGVFADSVADVRPILDGYGDLEI